MEKQKVKMDIEKVPFEVLSKTPLNQLRIFQPPDYIQKAFREIKKELKSKGLMINPQIWVSEEWICPDGTAGIGVPFYLSSKRLLRLEKQEVGFVEGETFEQAKKLIRHEIGHVIDNLFKLRRNRKRIEVFGKNSKRYPTRYQIKPYSKKFVRHLKEGYAQGHPSEDFAETFAVWLDPRSDWKRRYAGWGCLKKLELMDDLMASIKKQTPPPYDRNRYYDIKDNKKTYGRYLKERKKKFNLRDHFWDDLPKKLHNQKRKDKKIKITQFLNKHENEILSPVKEKLQVPKYILEKMLKDLKKQKSDLLISKELSSKKVLSYHISSKINAFINERRHFIPV